MAIDTQPARKQELSPDAVRGQVERVLSHPLINQSKRFERFLRHVTELALGPQPKPVSERDIGIEVFGRPTNYDTEADPIVRVTASEIRKRLTKYYADAEHADEIRIELQKGSYLPEFRMEHAPATCAAPLHTTSAVAESARRSSFASAWNVCIALGSVFRPHCYGSSDRVLPPSRCSGSR